MDDDKIFNDEAERPRIKVTDRRKFTADGTPLGADVDQKTAGDQPEPPAPAETEDPPAADAGNMNPAEQEPRIAAPQPSIADLPRDFSAFVESLYLEAMLYMGAIRDPHSGETVEDDELAKYKIDLLGMLQQKTEGNLTAEEKQQLEEVLYQLRMVFLQKSRAVPS